MNILITGGAGFIGHEAAKHLSGHHKVSIIDFHEKVSKIFNDDLSCYGFDISKDSWIKKLPKDFDVIIHCAAQTGGYYSLLDPQKDCMWNAVGTANVVSFSKKCKSLQKVLYLSSMAVYGEGRNKDENSDVNPISFYGCSKLAGEFYVKTMTLQTGIPHVILRLWNTYGFGQDLKNKHQGMLSIYLSQLLENKRVKVTGSLQRVRSFVHVDDVVNAITLCMKSEKALNQTFNVSTEESCSSGDLIEMIASSLGTQAVIEEHPGYVGDQIISTGISKKLKAIGWIPKTSLYDGIQEFTKLVGGISK
jgi:UDP-glucose 4-epimerase